MPMYRILPGHTLSLKKGQVAYAGSLVRLEWLDGNPAGVQALVDKGAISRVKPPPLAVLPGWKIRSGKVKVYGIEDAEQFLAASDVELAGALNVRAETVQKWKKELTAFMQAPPGKCCGG